MEEVIALASKYLDSSQIELMKKAYNYALEKHKDDYRLTNEPVISHLVEVVKILLSLNVDCDTICAAFLHEVLKNPDNNINEIEEIFGQSISKLVESVNKINKLSFSCNSEASIANERKILVGLTEDVRVIMIKLADRLHNMRTLYVHPENVQKDKAKETLDILVPIAHRLGMNKIKGELEDLSLRYLKKDVYFQIVEKLNEDKQQRDNLVLKMQEEVSFLLNKNSIKHEIKGRSKSIYSIYKKLDTGRKFSDIYDIYALRVFVDTIAECYQVLGIIHSKYRPIPKRFKDYIAMPKTNMYQSLHTTVFGVDGHLFEIQIRTYEMDKIAECGIASHWSYKEHKNMSSMQNEMEEKLQFFRSIMDLKEESDTDFINSVKDEFNNTIYVFTPKGDVIELPKGSTPIDFAYKVHTIVGNTMVGAIVNNQLVSLNTELNDNDIVKINVNRNSSPNYEWINMCKTAQAKNKIRSFFTKISKDDSILKGQELLNKELRKKKLSINEFLNNENLEKIFDEFKLSYINELYISIYNGKYKPLQFINFILDLNKTKEEIILSKTNKEIKVVIKNDIAVKGIDEIKINLASCCMPLPGDEIIGYITKGNGITVHRSICPNIKEHNERFIDVYWNNDTNKKYKSSIIIQTNDTKNILVDIVSKTSNNDIVIESANVYNSNQTYDISLLVKDKEKLNKFINELYGISSVKSIERKIL